MESGELAEPVRNRSVLRQLHIETTGSYGTRPLISTAGPLPGYSDMPWRQVTAAANSLSAMGAVPTAFVLQGMLPSAYEEAQLREDMKHFDEEARAEGAAFCHADIQVSGEITAPKYFVTGIGRYCAETTLPGQGKAADSPKMSCQGRAADSSETRIRDMESAGSDKQMTEPENTATLRKKTWNRTAASERRGLRPGQELILTRRIALAGTAALVRAHEDALRQRFPFRLVDRARGFGQWMSVTEAARAVNHFGSCPMMPLAQGGIYNALWEMAEQTGVGLEVDLKKIPIYQETVEICEYFDINPYYLYSAGALLIGTNRAEELIALLREKEIPACVIGRVTDKKERVIVNGENRRYLDRPKQDEWWRRNDANSITDNGIM